MGKEMMGTFNFEIDSIRWGEPSRSGAQRNFAGSWGADRAAVEVKNMFITFGMPWIPVPTTIQAGIHPIAVRPRFLLYTDGPGITAAMKIDPASIKLMWFKPVENEEWAADDFDIYGADINAKIQTLTIGGYGLYYKMNTYPLIGTDVRGTPTVDTRGQMWWIGVYLDGKMGPVNLSWDFGLDTGKLEDHRDRPAATLAKDVKYSGWATRLEATFPWEKFTFGGVGVYGSGADVKKTGLNGTPGQTVGTGAAPYTTTASKVGAFAYPPGSEGGPGDLYVINSSPDFLRGSQGMLSIPSTAMSRNLYGGLWYLKLFGSFWLTDADKFTVGVAYVGDTTKNGNTLGSARKTDGFLRDDKSIGWEFDLLNTLALYKNLSWEVGLGYVVAGKGLDLYNTATGTNVSPKDPWALGTRLVYSF
jgi:hypothetical protein